MAIKIAMSSVDVDGVAVMLQAMNEPQPMRDEVEEMTPISVVIADKILATAAGEIPAHISAARNILAFSKTEELIEEALLAAARGSAIRKKRKMQVQKSKGIMLQFPPMVEELE